MNPVTHFLVSWDIAGAGETMRRDRWLITISGVIPDLDGLGAIAELATRHSERPLLWFTRFHHILCHNIGFGLALAVAVFLLAREKIRTLLFAVGVFHLHLLCDIIGARGPDGSQWPVPYLLPFSDRWYLAVGWQWELVSWQNTLVTAAALVAMFYMAWRKGYSPLELMPWNIDARFTAALRRRFGAPSGAAAGDER
ncbi:MAG: metal-dependent hydrolase [Planctomycetes bacterium]|nr:metal-dependent hydrolase [Planctomycetota bacterium]